MLFLEAYVIAEDFDEFLIDQKVFTHALENAQRASIGPSTSCRYGQLNDILLVAGKVEVCLEP